MIGRKKRSIEAMEIVELPNEGMVEKLKDEGSHLIRKSLTNLMED